MGPVEPKRNIGGEWGRNRSFQEDAQAIIAIPFQKDPPFVRAWVQCAVTSLLMLGQQDFLMKEIETLLAEVCRPVVT